MMQNDNIGPMTAAVITFNSMQYIDDCLLSIKAAGLEECCILVVDDGSTDGTPAHVRSRYPEAGLVCLERNSGHSRACNEALRGAATEWVVLIDHDTVAHPEWLRELQAGLLRHPDAGLVVSRAVFAGDGETIHSDGGYVHYLGSMILRHGFTKCSNASGEDAALGAAGTTSLAVNREKALAVGLFDEDFFIYLNDFEFSLRMRLAGFEIFSAPRSIIYHKGGSQGVSFRGTGKYPSRRAYLIFRNRWIMLLKLYSLKTLLLCFPVLVLYEFIMLIGAVRKGVLKAYFDALRWNVKNIRLVLAKRKDTQIIRKVADRDLLVGGSLTFVPGLINSRWARYAKHLVEKFFDTYWKGVSSLL